MRRFDIEAQHSLRQVSMLREMYVGGRLSRSDALFLAAEMVNHGFGQAGEFVDQLRGQFTEGAAARFLESLKNRNEALLALPARQRVLGDGPLMRDLYERDNQLLIRGTHHPRKLLVVLTTMYNNFGISTPLLFAYLLPLGVSVMILKDSSLYNYLRGASSIGGDLDAIADYIRGVAAKLEAEELSYLAFSSGGFAGLYLALATGARRYAGFSVLTDFSDDSPFQRSKYVTTELLQEIAPRFRVDLRPMCDANSELRSVLFYGDRSYNTDIQHARHMEGARGVTVVELPDCAHGTVEYLIERGRFAPLLTELVDL